MPHVEHALPRISANGLAVGRDELGEVIQKIDGIPF